MLQGRLCFPQHQSHLWVSRTFREKKGKKRVSEVRMFHIPAQTSLTFCYVWVVQLWSERKRFKISNNQEDREVKPPKNTPTCIQSTHLTPHISNDVPRDPKHVSLLQTYDVRSLCTWGEPIPPHSTKRKLKVYVLISITWPSSAWCAAPFVSSFLARLDLSLGLGWYLDRTPGAKSSRGTTPSIPCSVNCQNENP